MRSTSAPALSSVGELAKSRRSSLVGRRSSVPGISSTLVSAVISPRCDVIAQSTTSVYIRSFYRHALRGSLSGLVRLLPLLAPPLVARLEHPLLSFAVEAVQAPPARRSSQAHGPRSPAPPRPPSASPRHPPRAARL